MNLSLGEEHGEVPRRGQSSVAGFAAELASCPHGIRDRPAPDSSAVLPDVHTDRHAVRHPLSTPGVAAAAFSAGGAGCAAAAAAVGALPAGGRAVLLEAASAGEGTRERLAAGVAVAADIVTRHGSRGGLEGPRPGPVGCVDGLVVAGA